MGFKLAGYITVFAYLKGAKDKEIYMPRFSVKTKALHYVTVNTESSFYSLHLSIILFTGFVKLSNPLVRSDI